MYRRKMHVSYREANATPRNVMLNDLEMMRLEGLHSRKPPEAKANK